MNQLKVAAESFMEGDDAVMINTLHKEVSLSMIFKWYREDFGSDHRKVL